MSANFKLSTNQTNGEKPSSELQVTLFDGENLPNTEYGLDSIAKSAATILKSSIRNINDYDWISIIFEVSDDGGVFNRPKKNVFVYRPTELN